MINLSLDQFKEEGSTLTQKAMSNTLGGAVQPFVAVLDGPKIPKYKYSSKLTNENGDTDCKDLYPEDGVIKTYW